MSCCITGLVEDTDEDVEQPGLETLEAGAGGVALAVLATGGPPSSARAAQPRRQKLSLLSFCDFLQFEQTPKLPPCGFLEQKRGVVSCRSTLETKSTKTIPDCTFHIQTN